MLPTKKPDKHGILVTIIEPPRRSGQNCSNCSKFITRDSTIYRIMRNGKMRGNACSTSCAEMKVCSLRSSDDPILLRRRWQRDRSPTPSS